MIYFFQCLSGRIAETLASHPVFQLLEDCMKMERYKALRSEEACPEAGEH
jgi:hypothetical protein